jgi:hypothetical protein
LTRQHFERSPTAPFGIFIVIQAVSEFPLQSANEIEDFFLFLVKGLDTAERDFGLAICG